MKKSKEDCEKEKESFCGKDSIKVFLTNMESSIDSDFKNIDRTYSHSELVSMPFE